MIDEQLISILACPETKKDLELASPKEVAKVNQAIDTGTLFNRQKERITEPINGGLFRRGDRGEMFPVRHDIPILLIEELLDVKHIFNN